MLVSAKEMMQNALEGKYAVGQFNINNLEWTKAILQTAEEQKSPVILGVSEGAGKYMCGFETVAAMVAAMDKSLGITVPVALHLDHGTYDGCYKCVAAGFTSIMFDGSHLPFEENFAKTTELVAVAHKLGLSIEAEVGAIGGEEDGVVGSGECADPEECKKIADLGVDFLAAGIGNIHGVYPENWAGLSFDTLEAVKAKVAEFIAKNPEIAKEYLAKVQGFLKDNADKIKGLVAGNAAVAGLLDTVTGIPSESVDALLNAGDALKGLGIDAASLAGKAVDAAGDAVEGAKDAAVDAAKDAKDAVVDKANDAVDAAKDKAGEAVDKAADGAKKALGI
jgi:fructose-bisphosphate aldolase class II